MILFEIYCYFLKNILTVLIVYVDIIIVTCDDPKEVKNIKRMLATEFEINHLRDSKYFLGIEVTRSNQGIYIYIYIYILQNVFLSSPSRNGNAWLQGL